MKDLVSDIYRNKKVLVTGHTGFKGSWLVLLLQSLGAKVNGVSLPPATNPSHIELIGHLLNDQLSAAYINISETEKVKKVFLDYKPEIIFHLAGQALVRYAYKNTIETFMTNVMGTLNVLEAARITNSLKAVVIVTSDKCYLNKEWSWGYRENDTLGGQDPYGTSKACAELVSNCYKHSFFNPHNYNRNHHCLIASARAGNVIGGGDWAQERLVPDLIRATINNDSAIIRNPSSIRPWQHVLEPLYGYLLLGQKLLSGQAEFSGEWNFGPRSDEELSVMEVAELIRKKWPKCKYTIQNLKEEDSLHESTLLRIDSSKANSVLKWKPIWDGETAIDKTIRWYYDYYEQGIVNSLKDINEYITSAL